MNNLDIVSLGELLVDFGGEGVGGILGSGVGVDAQLAQLLQIVAANDFLFAQFQNVCHIADSCFAHRASFLSLRPQARARRGTAGRDVLSFNLMLSQCKGTTFSVNMKPF